MRIALVVMSFAPGGAEILVRNLATALTEGGHDCHVVAVCSAESVGNPGAFEDYYRRSLEERGIGVEILARRAVRSPFPGAFRLRRALRRFRPDIVHLHAPPGLLFWAVAPMRIPTVYTHHNMILKFPAVLFRLFDRVVDRYVAVGEACRALLTRHVRKPVVLIYNGVPEPPGPAAERSTLPQRPVMLSVGNLTAQKDYGTLLSAARLVEARLREQGRTATFLIAGEGSDRSALQARIDAEGLGGFVTLLGARTDIGDLMRDATLLVNSSTYEGLPIALLEALQAGLPIVATRVGGNAEIVEDGRNGLLVEPRDPEALADRILAALADSDAYARMAAEAKRSAGAFGLDACVRAHLDLYRGLQDAS